MDDNVFVLAQNSFITFDELPYDLDRDVEFVHESGVCENCWLTLFEGYF